MIRRVMLNHPQIEDESVRNCLKEITTQINFALEDAEKEIKKLKEGKNNG